MGHYTSSIVNGRAYKIQKNNWTENSRVRIWSHCHYRRSFKSANWAIFVQSEDHTGVIPPRMMHYAKKSLQEYSSSTPWIEHGIITQLQKLDWEQEKRSERSCTVDVHTRTEGRRTFPLQGVCTICFDNSASEAEVITDPKKSRKVNYQIHWRREQNAKDWIYLSATQKRILADKV